MIKKHPVVGWAPELYLPKNPLIFPLREDKPTPCANWLMIGLVHGKNSNQENGESDACAEKQVSLPYTYFLIMFCCSCSIIIQSVMRLWCP